MWRNPRYYGISLPKRVKHIFQKFPKELLVNMESKRRTKRKR